ncbi:MAG: pyridoxamine 5'-phosphate oxidase [Pseudomonadota bacterium]|nr:pyridoxamine 5'-phosphate oxidase [Pseudomonadota bacterium]
MADDPFALFDAWFAEAKASEPNDPNAMALATVGADGRPSVRIVLLKSVDRNAGFTFHTNSESRKGRDMAENAEVALVLHWKSLRRQVRIEGRVRAASEAESDAYFATRARESQLSAWASRQSQMLGSRQELEDRQAAMEDRFVEGGVPRPPYWHGYRVEPRSIEFWSDGAHRLHNRRLFTRGEEGWTEGLLYP